MRPRLVVLSTAFTAVGMAGGTAAGASSATAYEYVVIADSSDGYELYGCPALNNAGDVAFEAIELGTGYHQVLRGSGGELTTIFEETATQPVGNFIARPAINDSGEVAFGVSMPSGDDDTVYATYRADGMTSVKIVEVGANPGNDVAISESGHVAYEDGPGGGKQNSGLFYSKRLGRAKPVYTYATSPLRNGGDISIGGAGDDMIAFTAGRADDRRELSLYIQSSDGTRETIASEGGAPLTVIDAPSLGADGEVAFAARSIDAADLIMVGDAGQLRTVADSTGPFRGLGSPSLNAAGTVVFTASLDRYRPRFRAQGGVYFGPNLETDAVIQPEDSLDGSTVHGAASCSESLNDAGQVAFVADLEDRRELVVRADPS